MFQIYQFHTKWRNWRATSQICKYVSQKYAGNFLISKPTSLGTASGSMSPSGGRLPLSSQALRLPLASSSDVLQWVLSDFPENLLFIENVGDEHPESGGDYVLDEMLFM